MADTSDKGFKLAVVQPDPAQAHRMPYAPAVTITGAADLMFVSGATPSPLYHDHPHVESQHDHVCDIREQTRLAMENIKLVLDDAGANLARCREGDQVHDRHPRLRRHQCRHGALFRRLEAGLDDDLRQPALLARRARRARYDRGVAEAEGVRIRTPPVSR